VDSQSYTTDFKGHEIQGKSSKFAPHAQKVSLNHTVQDEDVVSSECLWDMMISEIYSPLGQSSQSRSFVSANGSAPTSSTTLCIIYLLMGISLPWLARALGVWATSALNGHDI